MRQKLGRLGIAALIHGATILLLCQTPQRLRTLPPAHRPQRLYLLPATLQQPPAMHAPASAAPAPGRPRHMPRSPQPDLPPLADTSTPQQTQPAQASESTTFNTFGSIGPNAATIAAQARRDLRRIDKEVLNGASAVPARPPDSLSARLARGIDGAFVGATSEVSDHYSSPDGVMYSRITRGNRSTCYSSGTPSYAAATRSGGNWVRVNCPPPDSGWVR